MLIFDICTRPRDVGCIGGQRAKSALRKERAAIKIRSVKSTALEKAGGVRPSERSWPATSCGNKVRQSCPVCVSGASSLPKGREIGKKSRQVKPGTEGHCWVS